MKNSEIKELSSEDIKDKVSLLKESLVKMRINHKVSPIDKPEEFGIAKKKIARLKTELRQREIKKQL